MEINHKTETSLGMDENIEGLLCYVLGWVSGIAFLILEKSNKFVRFHAMQSLITFLSITAASMILGVIPYFGWLLSLLLWIISLLLWIIMMLKALKGEWYKLPVAGDFAERFVGKEGVNMQPEAGRFCGHCGAGVNRGDRFCGKCGARLDSEEGTAAPEQVRPAAAASGDKESMLKALEEELLKYPGLTVNRSDKTDLEIKSVLADADWGVGKKKVEYSACLLAKDGEHTIVFWEMIKETGSGIDFGAGFKTESFKSGKTLSGNTSEVKYGPDGKVIDYEWDYGKTRSIIEQAAEANGWRFKTVLMKGKAMY
jgi:uncharacterized membrane protein